jgi:hypothetical protein
MFPAVMTAGPNKQSQETMDCNLCNHNKISTCHYSLVFSSVFVTTIEK